MRALTEALARQEIEASVTNDVERDQCVVRFEIERAASYRDALEEAQYLIREFMPDWQPPLYPWTVAMARCRNWLFQRSQRLPVHGYKYRTLSTHDAGTKPSKRLPFVGIFSG